MLLQRSVVRLSRWATPMVVGTALRFAICVALVHPAQGLAQYMYLDSNGNGVHDAGDRFRTCPTRFDVWLNTANNRNGSPAACPVGSGALDLSHYEFALQAVGGTVTWGPMSSQVSGFSGTLARDARDTTGTVFYHNGASSGTPQAPGLYKLASLTATLATGSPRIDIITRHPVNGTGRTSFGSTCAATLLFDHTNRHGLTWSDVDGLAAPGPSDARPRITAPGIVVPTDGGTVGFTVTATDVDVDPILVITTNMSALPPGNDAQFSVSGAFTPTATGTFTWTPTAADSGDYVVTFTATNCLDSFTRDTIIHVIGAVSSAQPPSNPLLNFLAANQPNPFSPETSIDYSLAKEAEVRVRIYSANGRAVRTLVNSRMPAGPHVTSWNGTDDSGRPVASGVYLCRLESGSFRMSRRMILLR